MPRRDQSGWRHVRRCMSKISTPLCMASRMASLEDWKAVSSSGDHENWQRALRNGLNGAMRSGSWGYLATWLTRPNQLLMSVVEVGDGNSLIASRYFGSGSIDESQTRREEVNCSPPVLLQVGVVVVSSTQRSLRSNVESTASNRRLYPSPEDRKPWGALV